MAKHLPQLNIQTTVGPITAEYVSIPPEKLEGLILISIHSSSTNDETIERTKSLQSQLCTLFPKASFLILNEASIKVNTIDPKYIKNGGEYLIGVNYENKEREDEYIETLTKIVEKKLKSSSSIGFYKSK